MQPACQPSERTGDWYRPVCTIIGLYVLPVVLLLTGVIAFRWRFLMLVAMSIVAVGLALSRHSADSLGLSLPGLKTFVKWAVLPSVGFIGVVSWLDLPHRHLAPAHIAFYCFFVFVSAPAQEFLYRSFLFAEMGKTRIPPIGTVLLSAALFGFMHLIYRDVATVLFTLVAGLGWAVAFHMTRRVGIVAASHAVLGVVAIMTGLV